MLRFLSIALLVIATAALAQDEKAAKEELKTSGTFRGGTGSVLQVATSSNELWNVRLPSKAEDISFTGTAEPSFLRPGMYVKLSGVINKKGQLVEPISSLLVFTPLERGDLGLYAGNADNEPVNTLGNLFAPEKPETNEQPKGKGPKKPVEPPVFRIGGQITGIKAGKLTIKAGPLQIKGELDEKVKIRVSTANLAFAQLGDKVEVEGWYYASARQQGAWANKISVIAANKLEGEVKKPKAEADSEDTNKKGTEKKGTDKKDTDKKDTDKKDTDKKDKEADKKDSKKDPKDDE